MSHRLQATHFPRKPSAIKRDMPVAPQWPSYQGTSQFVGASPSGRVNVFVDPTLGDPGLQNAQDLVNDADRVAIANDQIFGTPSGVVSVVVVALGGVTDGTGGADHATTQLAQRLRCVHRSETPLACRRCSRPN